MIGAGSVLGADVRIGADCFLHPRVTLAAGSELGARTRIQSGVVIGSDGFGFAREAAGWTKVPQLGRVRIGADVEVGANTTIDRGAIDDTVIADGVKLDNLIQIAHNVQIGAHTVIAACCGISGSTSIGARCVIAGAVMFAGHLNICDDVVVTGHSSVTHSLTTPGVYSGCIPVTTAPMWRRLVGRFKRLDVLNERVRRLERGDDRFTTTGPRLMNAPLQLDIHAILKRLPHRYPFLLVDRVLECVPGKSIRALKNVTINEPFFQGHFPQRPVMPGVIIIEALAQAAGILTFVTADAFPNDKTVFYFVGIDKARFRRPVEPGDQLTLSATLERTLRGIWKMATIATVGDAEAATAELMLAPGTIINPGWEPGAGRTS